MASEATTTDQEIATLNVPTFFVNKMFVSYNGEGMKITFAEESLPSKAMQPRTAVFLSPQAFNQLSEILTSILKQYDEVVNKMPMAAAPVELKTVN